MSTETVVRERGIPMSAPMVRAVLDGRKTQTRRVIKPQPEFFQSGDNWLTWRQGTRVGGGRNESAWASHALDRCPSGAPGDRLWVRETWGWNTFGGGPIDDEPEQREIVYRASRPTPLGLERWRPSIHMPRWASRLTLEITDVRVQRVQEISEDDARAEGISVLPLQSADDPSAWWQSAPGQHQARTPRMAFAALWDSINAARGYGWNANPWCWCLTFRRVEAR